jgi:hypothetical protein
LVAEIRVEGRNAFRPRFRVPNILTDANTPTSGGVRRLSNKVELRSQNANPPLLVKGPTVGL